MNRYLYIAIVSVLIGALCGCGKTANKSTPNDTHHGEHGHKRQHATAHGGILNAVETCENGHVEMLVEDEKMSLWFVGGGSDTLKSVTIPDASIELNVKFGETEKTMVLQAEPLELAGERVGECSHFVGTLAELDGAEEFVAEGKITFRGKPTVLRLEYPDGYDPD